MPLRIVWVSREDLQRLRALRARYWDELVLPYFTKAERRRLRFLRWLVQRGRMRG